MRLNQARERAGLTLEEAGQRLGVSSQYVWKLERGVNTPPAWERLRDMCEEYGVSADWMLCFIDDPTPAAQRTMPAYGAQILTLLRSVPEEKQAEIYDVARVIAERAKETAEREAALDRLFDMLDALHGPGASDAMLELVRRAAAGDEAGALADFHKRFSAKTFTNEG